MCANPPTLRTAIARRASVTYRKWVKWLEMGHMLGKPPEGRQQHCPLPDPSATHRATMQ